MTIKEFKVGQTVYIIGDGRSERNKHHATAAEVVKVGRKYVTISGHWEQKFKDTSERRPYLIENTEYGAPRLLFPSKKAVDEYVEREELKIWLQKAAGWARIDRYTLAQLRAVKKILEGAGASGEEAVE